MAARATEFHEHLVSLGLPVVGVFQPAYGASDGIHIEFAEGATAKQIAKGNAEVAAFDWTETDRRVLCRMEAAAAKAKNNK